jgi:hypothetical protein
MTVLAALATKGRADRVTKKTWRWLQHADQEHIRLFVEKPERKLYETACPGARIETVDHTDQGLGHTKRFISQWAEEHGYRWILKLDDDWSDWRDFYGYCYAKAHQHPSKPTFEQNGRAFARDRQIIEQVLTEHGGACGGITFEYGQFMSERKKQRPKAFNTMGAPAECCYVAEPGFFREGWEHIFGAHEEAAVMLACRETGKMMPQYHWGGFCSSGFGKNLGGLQTWGKERRAETTRRAEEWLKQRFPRATWKADNRAETSSEGQMVDQSCVRPGPEARVLLPGLNATANEAMRAWEQ